MSPVPCAVTQRPSFYLILCILKDFHDFHELREYYGQSHSKECYPCFNSKIFLFITVDKSCTHRMHLHSFIPSFQDIKIPSSFLHFFILSFQFPSTRLLPCFHATERKSRTYAQEVITIFAIQISVQQWRRMGTDHSLQVSQIPSFRSKCFSRQGLGFAFKRGIFSVLPWQHNIT